MGTKDPTWCVPARPTPEPHTSGFGMTAFGMAEVRRRDRPSVLTGGANRSCSKLGEAPGSLGTTEQVRKVWGRGWTQEDLQSSKRHQPIRPGLPACTPDPGQSWPGACLKGVGRGLPDSRLAFMLGGLGVQKEEPAPPRSCWRGGVGTAVPSSGGIPRQAFPGRAHWVCRRPVRGRAHSGGRGL